MDKFQFQSTMTPQQSQFQSSNIFDVAQRARQNPKAFEDHIRQTNPQAYQRAMQIRNSTNNPQQVVMQMAQQRGLNPNILRMFDI